MFKRLARSPVIPFIGGTLIWAYMSILSHTMRWRVEGIEHVRKIWDTPQGWVARDLAFAHPADAGDADHLPAEMAETSAPADADGLALAGWRVHQPRRDMARTLHHPRLVVRQEGQGQARRRGGARGDGGDEEGRLHRHHHRRAEGPAPKSSASARSSWRSRWMRRSSSTGSRRTPNASTPGTACCCPNPFARGAVVIPEPIPTSKDMDSEELRQRVERALKAATARADELAGLAPDAKPAPRRGPAPALQPSREVRRDDRTQRWSMAARDRIAFALSFRHAPSRTCRALVRRTAPQDRQGTPRAHRRTLRPHAGAATRWPLLWLHGASVGESRLLLDVFSALRSGAADLHALVTTQTLTSADMIADGNQPDVIHQMAPVDGPERGRALPAALAARRRRVRRRRDLAEHARRPEGARRAGGAGQCAHDGEDARRAGSAGQALGPRGVLDLRLHRRRRPGDRRRP